MKRLQRSTSLLIAAAAMLGTAYAADGTWADTTTIGTWTNTGSWLDSTIADGSGFTANFTSDITGDTTITLGADRTIGNILFSDNGLLGSAWTLTGSTLTLAGSTPTITTTTNATIASVITGTAGLVKAGAGTLTLSAQNTYTGGTIVNEGKLILSGSTGGNTRLKGAITVNSGATLLVTGGDNSTGLGYNGQVTGLTINGGTVTADTVTHIWHMGSGVTLTGGTLQSNNGVSTTSGGQLEWGNTALNTLASATTSTVGGRLNIRTDANATLTVTVADGVAATDLLVTAAITGGSGASVTKSGAGLMALTAANTYDGTTTVNAGTLAISGANGSISSAVVINSGGTLKIDNTGAVNNTNRLADAKAITLSGGTLNFSHDGAAGVNFSETTGTVNGLGGTITTSQAAVGQTSILTLGGFLGAANFTGTGLGLNDRNKILITGGVNNALLGSFNTTGLALYSTTLGVVEATYTDVPFAGTIADGATTNVRLTGGTSGNVLLGSTVTSINALLQNQASATTIDTASKTLRFGAAGGVVLAAGKAGLTIGTAVNSGTITAGGADNTAGTLTLANNDATAVLTVNSVIANNGTGVVGVTTGGAGKVVLAGTNTFTGNLVLGAATTEISGASQTISGTISGAGSLLKSNAASTLTLTSASNSFTGGITISGGTLEIGGAGRLGSGTYAGAIVNNANFRYASSANQTLSGAISGSGAFTKAGSGTLTLTKVLGNSGVTNIDGGTLLLNYDIANSNFGSNRININNGSRLELTGGRIDFGNQTYNYDANGGGTISVASGVNWVATGSWIFQTNGGAKNTLGGTGSLNMNGGNGVTFNVARGTDSASDLDVTVANGIGNNSGPLIKNGTGILTLATTVNHTGATTINAGTVVLSGSGTVGAITNTSGITLNAGGTLTLANTSSANNTNRLRDAATVTMNGGTLNFNNNAGAVNYSETAGALTVASGSGTIAIAQAASGQTSTLTFASITRTGGTVDFTGASLGTAVNTRGEIRIAAAPTLTNGILGTWATVNGTDFATVTGANNSIVAYNSYADVTRLGASAATIADGSTTNVRLTEGTGSAFNILLGAATTTIHTLTQSANGGASAATIDPAGQTLAVNSILVASGAGALTIGNGTNNGTLKSAGTDLAIINNSAATTTVNSVITDGTGASTLTKGGSGTLVLTGANTFTGGISIGGTLEIGGSGTLGNTGSYAGAIANGGILKINTTANQTLTGVISGTGSLVKEGSGVLTLDTAQNTYTGGTIVNAGTLTLARAGGGSTALVGSITINSGAKVNATAGNVFGWTNGFTGLNINGGTFDGGSNQQHFYNDNAGNVSINMTGGTLTLGGTANASSGNQILNVPITVFASPNQSVINGTGQFGIRNNSTQVFDVGNGAQDIDLLASIIIGEGSSGSSGAITKNGTGTMAMTGANSYGGATAINAGALRIGHNTALGTTAGGVTVASGAALEIYNGITVGSEALTLNGTGISNGGALRNISGTNSHSGGITLASATRINSDAGTLTLSGSMSGAGQNLTLGGTGNITITGSIGTGSGSLTKDGNGTVLLNGSNSFSGGVTVNAGVLAVDGNQVSNRLASNAQVTINNGGTFEIRGLNALPGGTNGIDVTVNSSGIFSVITGNSAASSGGSHAHIRNLTLDGGTVNFGYSGSGGAYNGESIQLNGNVTVSGSSTSTIQSTGNTGNTGLALAGSNLFTVNDATGNSASDLIVSAEIENKDSGANGFTKAGAGTMELTGANSYTGATTISAGKLLIARSTVADNFMASSGYAIAANATMELNYTGATGSRFSNVNNTVSGAGTFVKSGSGLVWMANVGASMYTTFDMSSGAWLDIQGGTLDSLKTTTSNKADLTIASGATLSTPQSALYFNALNGAGSLSLGGQALTLGLDNGGGTFSGVISGANSTLTKTGSGTLTLSGVNTYSGKTTVANGTLAFSSGDASATANQQLGTNAAVDLGVAGATSGTLRYTGASGTLAKNINALGAGSDTVQNAGSGLLTLSGTLTKNGTVLTLKGGASGINVTGSIVGAAANSDLVVDGGTTTLSGANTYNGPTFVRNGATLITANTSALGSGNVTVDSGTTLQVGSGSAHSVTLGSGASLVVAGTLSLGAADSSVTMSGGGSFNFSGGSVYIGSLFDSDVGRTTYQLISGATGTGTTNVTGFDTNVFSDVDLDSNGYLVFTAIPEPSTYGLLGAGALALTAAVRRRRRTK